MQLASKQFLSASSCHVHRRHNLAPLRRLNFSCASAAISPATGLNGDGNGVHQLSVGTMPPPPVAVVKSEPAPPPPPGILPPAANYNSIVAAGAAKAALPAWKILGMGILAGCYVSFGAFMALTAAAMCGGLGVTEPILTRLVMGAVFPFGLLIILVCGAELFTGNTAFVTVAMLEKKASLKDLIKNWTLSYMGNFIGSLLMVAMVAATGLLANSPVAVKMVMAKTAIPFGQALVRGVLCNWLVCSAVWMASAATSLPGKMLAAYLPVMAFVTMGLEHSVANMFFCTMGIVQGAPVSFVDFLVKNLLPVTIGNTLAGVVCMALAYSFFYGSKGKATA